MSANLVFDGDASKYETGDPLLNLPQEKRAYVEEVAYYAQREYERRVAAGEDWVLPEVAVSQAILETGWGRSRGANDFGIKAWKGSDRSKTTLKTKEEAADGSLYSTNAAFEQTSSIEDSVQLYYDFITSISRYSKALNLTDPEQSIREIAAAGYATSSSYDDNLISILNKYNLSRYSASTTLSFDYSSTGYDEGVIAYEEAKKIIINLEETIDAAENNIKAKCLEKPSIDYQSVIEFEKIKETVITMKDLLERIKGIADREKYIAEQYDENDTTGRGLSLFQTASLSLGTINYSFNSNEEFKQLVADYKASSSSQTFSTWFQGYISSNGVKSGIIDMNEYTTTIKETYAQISENKVISVAGKVLNTNQQRIVENSSSKTENSPSQQPTTSQELLSSTKPTQQLIRPSQNTTIQEITVNKYPTKNNESTILKPSENQEIKNPENDNNHSELSNPKENTQTILQSTNNTLLQPGYISSNKSDSIIKDIASTTPSQQTSEQNIQVEEEIPTQSTVTEIIPGTNNDVITNESQKSKKANEDSSLAIGIGVGAAALGIGAGTYYIAKHHANNHQPEKYVNEEENNQEEYYEDDYYEDEQNLFPEDGQFEEDE